MKNKSIWLDNIDFKVSKSLDKNIDVDVLIVGGGMTGLSTTYHLSDSNLKVALVERNIIANGVTARTTGKLTYLQELIYNKIKTFVDEDSSKLYLQSQKEAIKLVKDIVNKNEIDCDFEEVTSYVFTQKNDQIKKIRKEKELLESFGVKVKEATKLPDGTDILYGICVDDTAIFHPIKYLIKIKEICLEKNVSIYENTKVTNIEKVESGYTCKAGKYQINAKKVVLAVHYPSLFSFFTPLKSHLEKSYLAAYKVDKPLRFSAITSANPTISLRYHKNYRIHLDNSHNLSIKNDEKQNFQSLIASLPKRPDFIWSNKDIITNDYLPYIGKIDDNLLIGNGYNTWGMTNGSLAGKIISDIILQKDNLYINLFSPSRSINLGKIVNFPITLGSNVKSFAGTKLVKNKPWYQKNVIFKKHGLDNIAIYTDEQNKKHIVYNRCPHFKCSLIFNEVEKTWDCPCHGSRFDIDGKCIEGPSNYNITYKNQN